MGYLILIALYVFAAAFIPYGFAHIFRALRARFLGVWLPTVKAKAVFIGLVELNGTAECEIGAAIKAPMSGRSCVYLETFIEEERLEEIGNKTKRVWRLIRDDKELIYFYLRDETGTVRINARGAEMTKERLYDRTFDRSQPEFSKLAGGVPEAPNSCGRRRFVEIGLPLHSNIYVWGRARVRTDAAAAEIAADPEKEPFFRISKSETGVRKRGKEQEKSLGAATWLCCLGVFGFPMALVAANILKSQALGVGIIAMGGVYVPIWTVGATITIANALIELRRRVDQAKANVDVELKRRADLMPALAKAAREAARHERAVLEMSTILRSQQAILRIDDAETGKASALAPRLLAVGEKYPELGANKTFAYLQQGVVDAEERVALAREFYNSIAESYETRRKTFPYSLIAALWRLPEAKFFAAEGFEAKTVDVELEA